MSRSRASPKSGATPASGADAVACYKSVLRDLVDRRPSGTRQRIAVALGKHKSFVSQLTNPSYPMPVPAKHLGTIFELCHFSPEERRSFMAAYERAHPGRAVPRRTAAGDDRLTIPITVPVLANAERQAALADAVQRVAAELGELARDLDQAAVGAAEREKKIRRRRTR